jgi:hypothetical protein
MIVPVVTLLTVPFNWFRVLSCKMTSLFETTSLASPGAYSSTVPETIRVPVALNDA